MTTIMHCIISIIQASVITRTAIFTATEVFATTMVLARTTVFTATMAITAATVFTTTIIFTATSVIATTAIFTRATTLKPTLSLRCTISTIIVQKNNFTYYLFFSHIIIAIIKHRDIGIFI